MFTPLSTVIVCQTVGKLKGDHVLCAIRNRLARSHTDSCIPVEIVVSLMDYSGEMMKKEMT